MSEAAIEALVDRWVSDESFRAEMKRDPLGTIDREGIDLTDEERQALAGMDLDRPDDELRGQMSIAAAGGG